MKPSLFGITIRTLVLLVLAGYAVALWIAALRNGFDLTVDALALIATLVMGAEVERLGDYIEGR